MEIEILKPKDINEIICDIKKIGGFEFYKKFFLTNKTEKLIKMNIKIPIKYKLLCLIISGKMIFKTVIIYFFSGIIFFVTYLIKYETLKLITSLIYAFVTTLLILITITFFIIKWKYDKWNLQT